MHTTTYTETDWFFDYVKSTRDYGFWSVRVGHAIEEHRFISFNDIVWC